MKKHITQSSPNFSAIPPELQSAAWEYWEEGNILGVMLMAGHADRGQLVMQNIKPLRERGFYEIALYEAYIHGPHFPPDQWCCLFSFADRDKLLQVGDSIPLEPLLVYRGVSCVTHRKWIRGMSWTTNKHTAAWFATRFAVEGRTPAVYSLRVNPEDVFFMTNDRKEDEAVIAAWRCGRMKRMEPMPEAIKPG